MRNIFCFILVYVFSAPVFAGNLSDYRTDQTEKNESLASDRVKTLRKLLKTDGVNITQDDLPNVRARRKFSSSFFKEIVNKAVDQLRDEDRYGTPDVFDPSKTINRIDREQLEKRRRIFSKAVGSFQAAHARIFKMIVIADREKQQRRIKAKAETVLTAGISEYIKENEPKAAKSIEEILGKLEWAEVYEGHVLRLVFGKPAKIKMSLSMLVTFRTDEDAYFLESLSFFLDRYQRAYDDIRYKKDKNGKFEYDKKTDRKIPKDIEDVNMSKIREIIRGRRYVSSRLDGAIKANKAMTALSPRQLHFLIDLLLQLRGNDVPVVEDVDLFIKATTIVSKKDPSKYVDPAVSVTNDIAYYKQLHNELYKLEDFIRRESSALELHQETLKAIRSKK